jgi:hypothetical protein
MKELNAYEAVFGFASYLTTLENSYTIGVCYDAARMADLATEFCEVNNFSKIREGWDKLLKHPKKKIEDEILCKKSKKKK